MQMDLLLFNAIYYQLNIWQHLVYSSVYLLYGGGYRLTLKKHLFFSPLNNQGGLSHGAGC